MLDSRYDEYFIDAAKRFNLDPRILKSLARFESNGDIRALAPETEWSNGERAAGLMQMLPSTFKSMGGKNLYDPVEQIYAGARYLRERFDQEGDIFNAIRGYHGGPDHSKWGQAGYQHATNVLNAAPEVAFAPPRSTPPAAPAKQEPKQEPEPAPATPAQPEVKNMAEQRVRTPWDDPEPSSATPEAATQTPPAQSTKTPWDDGPAEDPRPSLEAIDKVLTAREQHEADANKTESWSEFAKRQANAAGSGLFWGATLGHPDAVAGAAASIDPTDPRSYSEARDEYRAQQQREQNAAPIAAAAGKVGGSVLANGATLGAAGPALIARFTAMGLSVPEATLAVRSLVSGGLGASEAAQPGASAEDISGKAGLSALMGGPVADVVGAGGRQLGGLIDRTTGPLMTGFGRVLEKGANKLANVMGKPPLALSDEAARNVGRVGAAVLPGDAIPYLTNMVPYVGPYISSLPMVGSMSRYAPQIVTGTDTLGKLGANVLSAADKTAGSALLGGAAASGPSAVQTVRLGADASRPVVTALDRIQDPTVAVSANDLLNKPGMPDQKAWGALMQQASMADRAALSQLYNNRVDRITMLGDDTDNKLLKPVQPQAAPPAPYADPYTGYTGN